MSDSQERVEKVLGDKYEIRGLIQSGGMGKIFLGVHKALGKKVAIKIIHQELGKDEQFKIRFYREAKLASSLDHPGIIDIYDFGSNEDFDYIIMPFIDGETFQQHIKKEGPFQVPEALGLMIRITEALHHAHQRNVYHRDIKPANIMFDGQGRVIIADFGISKEIGDSDLTAVNTVLGSPRYMSPEQIRGGIVDARGDLYSLGLVFYEMVAGEHPFQGKETTALYYAQAHEIPPRPEVAVPGIPRKLGDIIMRLLEKTPEKRYAHGGELLDDLRNYQNNAAVVHEEIDDATIVDSRCSFHDDATLVGDGTLVAKAVDPRHGSVSPPKQDGAEQNRLETGFSRKRRAKIYAGAAGLLAMLLMLVILLPGKSTEEIPIFPAADDSEGVVDASGAPAERPPEGEMASPRPGGPSPDKPARVASASDASRAGNLLEKIQSLGDGRDADFFSVWTDQADYRIGQPMRFYFETAKPCYALILVYTTSRELIQVFPNHYSGSQFVRQGSKYEIPDDNFGFDLQVTGPAGTDTLIALVSDSPFELLGASFSEQSPFLAMDTRDAAKTNEILIKIESLQPRDIFFTQTTYQIR